MNPTITIKAIKWPTIAPIALPLPLGTIRQAVRAIAIGTAAVFSGAMGCGGWYLSATNIPWVPGETIQGFAARKEAIKQGIY